MEQPLLLLMLFTLLGNDETKKALENALQFYREHKELLALFINPANTASGQEKSRPEEAGNQSINSAFLEEFLKTHGA